VSNNHTDPIPMLLHCPLCGKRHIDEGDFATKSHTTHACQFCGMVWRPAIVPTVGVQFLPGFKNEVQEVHFSVEEGWLRQASQLRQCGFEDCPEPAVWFRFESGRCDAHVPKISESE
jgi:hypothetical protein